MGFKYERRRTLQERMKKYIPKEEYDAVIQRQVEYLRNESKKNTIRKNDQIKQIKHKEKQQKDIETCRKLNEMYDNYKKYGVRYMKNKFSRFNTVQFLKKCSKYNVIDYKPSKNTNKLKIKYKNGEYGLNEIERMLNVTSKHSIIVGLHINNGLSYEEIFQSIEDGTFSQLKINKVQSVQKDKSEFQKFVDGIWYGKPDDQEYVIMCDMNIQGKSIEEIEKWYHQKVCRSTDNHHDDDEGLLT